MNPEPTYAVRRAPRDISDNLLADAFWADASVAALHHFHPHSTAHRPAVQARLLWDDRALYGRFDVEDRYILARHTAAQSQVSEDSCVEFFFRPTPHNGYFNFEFNAIGCALTYYITDPTRIKGGFRAFRPLTPLEMQQIRVQTTLQKPTETEIPGPLSWKLAFEVAWPLVRREVPGFNPETGESSGNFYKCADLSSHPHWAAWATIGEPLNFHQPDRFGRLRFEKGQGMS